MDEEGERQTHQAKIYLAKLDKERGNLTKMLLKPPDSLDEEREIQKSMLKSIASKLVDKLDEEREIQTSLANKYQVGWPEKEIRAAIQLRPSVLAKLHPERGD